MAGLTFDAGALIALERRKPRMLAVWRSARRDDVTISVPGPAIAEWWRGRTDVREDILASIDVEPVDADLARRAGEALAGVEGATTIDAIVMASAARRGDIVYTSDVDDFSALQRYFRSVRVFGV